jgi:signal transduction histidine kinase
VEEVTTVYQEAKDVYNQKFELECPYEKLEGILDGAALRRVLENLLTNAIKYGDRNEPITISLKDLGDSVEISVKNLGNPISKAKQHSIFSFLTKEKNTHSTNLHSWGIGLTLVKLVTQAHRGKVEVESSKQNGTVFTITIGKQPGEEGKVRTILNSEKTLSEN